jgi:hypothetical protein
VWSSSVAGSEVCFAHHALRTGFVTRLIVNGKAVDVTGPADMPLRWALRDVLALTGTKVHVHGPGTLERSAGKARPVIDRRKTQA